MLENYDNVYLIDFEYNQTENLLPNPICLVVIELYTGKVFKYWKDELESLTSAPFDTSDKSLTVAYYIPAEMSCFLELNWTLPVNIIDLFFEFKNLKNGRKTTLGNSLLFALKAFNIPHVEDIYKDEMRELILSNTTWNSEDKERILKYCKSDVIALSKLIPHFKNTLNDSSTQIFGEYMKAIAVIEKTGTPIDIETLNKLKANWDEIRLKLIKKLDKYSLFDGLTFKVNRFSDWLGKNNVKWPHTPTGKPETKEETFKLMFNTYPDVKIIFELRKLLGKLKLNNLKVGADGRNRCLLSPFGSKTGRNQPSTTKFIFGLSSWMRSLIKPNEGFGVVYIDWSQQEFGIAAALSKDKNMIKSYQSGDPYLQFAKMAGAVPKDATKKSHPKERELYKQCVLATQYGMGAESLAIQIKSTIPEAKRLLEQHKKIFSTFWTWSENCLDHARLENKIKTCFGWTLNVHADTKTRTIQNFPMQATGAEMLRIAIILAVEREIKVCAPVHDALLIEARTEDLEQAIKVTQDCMKEASKCVLDGFEIATDVETFVYPARFVDKRGLEMWETVMDILEEIE